jgi:cell fate (sporulation/competence/biofilm development) regulator YlbF (YheA/YmcA/DUF963 family)
LNRDEIIRMALELGNSIAASPERAEVGNAQEQVMQNLEARQMVLEFQNTRNRLMEKNQQGLAISEAEGQELQNLEQNMLSNDIVKELVAAEEQFNHLMQAVYFTINQAVFGNMCSDGCDSCGGSCG